MKSSTSTHIVKKQLFLKNIVTLHLLTWTTSSTVQPTRKTLISINILGVPNSTVKRSHGVNVQNLIKKIENNPQRQALQSDLQQHRAFDPFSKESRGREKAAGKTELCELLDVEPKNTMQSMLGVLGRWHRLLQERALLTKMIRQRTRSTSSPFLISSLSRTFTSGKADHTVTGTERKKGIKKDHTANQLQKKCKKREFLSIHDRFHS